MVNFTVFSKQKKAGIITEEQFTKKKTELEEKSQKEKRRIERDAAIKKKVASLSEIAINTAVAITRTTADLGAVAAIPFIPLLVAQGIVQAGVVASQPLPQLRTGGKIPASKNKYVYDHTGQNLKSGGKVTIGNDHTGTADTVLAVNENNLPVARISTDEYVMNANSTRLFFPIIEHLNNIGLRGFNIGGITAPSFVSTSTSTNNTTLFDTQRIESLLEAQLKQKLKAYVVSTEMTAQQNKDYQIEDGSIF